MRNVEFEIFPATIIPVFLSLLQKIQRSGISMQIPLSELLVLTCQEAPEKHFKLLRVVKMRNIDQKGILKILEEERINSMMEHVKLSMKKEEKTF